MKTPQPVVCVRCVMDSTVQGIRFDSDGVCNYCTSFEHHGLSRPPLIEGQDQVRIGDLVQRVKEAGRGRPYDCIVGVSGGVDSSWVLVNAVRYGLRPLAVHMDNGWNSELAQNNIANLIRALGVDLYTHVIEWEEYRALMQGFFDADVIDVELLYDNAMLAVNYIQAARLGLRYILAGDNHATEGMHMPPGWNWFKYDKRNIQGIGKHFGRVRLRSFPAIGTLGLFYYAYLKRIEWVAFLDLLEYNKFEALEELERHFAYKRYPYKHYESVFTRFYQGYLLPRKFGVDKRRLHLSTLIMSGQIGRDEALALLAGNPYPDPADLERDLHYFLKKMSWTPQQLQDYLMRPAKPHTAYPSEKALWDLAKRIATLTKPTTG